MESISIKVGIKTSGSPILQIDGGVTVLKNMLIGDRFHWQTTIEAKLPGNVKVLSPVSFSKGEGGRSNYGADNVSIVNTLPLETYLQCVVGSEMNPEAPIEFLKAHAIISRSWALGKIIGCHQPHDGGKIDSSGKLIGWEDTQSHIGFHVCSDDHCQRYQGIQDISAKATEAIISTEDKVLVSSDGKLVDARFSKCCGGYTERFETCWQDISPDCIESKADPWCNLEKKDMIERRQILESVLKDYDIETQGYGYKWESEISKSEIRKNLRERFGRDLGEIREIAPVHRGPSGRIDLIKIKGEKGELEFGKELWIRRLLSPSHLYSSAFRIFDRGSKLHFEGRGWGHGVGLCQIGAANWALNGGTCEEILNFYYPGSHIQTYEKYS